MWVCHNLHKQQLASWTSFYSLSSALLNHQVHVLNSNVENIWSLYIFSLIVLKFSASCWLLPTVIRFLHVMQNTTAACAHLAFYSLNLGSKRSLHQKMNKNHKTVIEKKKIRCMNTMWCSFRTTWMGCGSELYTTALWVTSILCFCHSSEQLNRINMSHSVDVRHASMRRRINYGSTKERRT